MKTATTILATLFVAGCSPTSRTAPEPAVDRNEGMAEAQAAVAGAKNDVLEQRVHALEIAIAELQNSAKATNTAIFDDRLKAVEQKVYAVPDAAATGATPAARKPAAVDGPRAGNPFATYRPPTSAEREAVDRLARSAPPH